MMKKILFIDDNLGELENSQKELEYAGFNCHIVKGISDAEELLKINEYGCLIIDLNMDNTHLPKKYKDETESGMFTGWVWLYRVVEPSQLAGPSAKYVIYSAYIEELKERIQKPDCQHDERVFFYDSRIEKITKAEASNGKNVLVEKLIRILGDNK
jgi:CheY-like chemotaxis protein